MNFLSNKKGFTLVEMISVLVILGLVTVIAVPTINNIVKQNRQKLYDQQIEEIIESAKVWGSNNISKLPSEGESDYVITLGELKKEGYADKDLTNPKTDELFDDEFTKVNISNKNGILYYEVIVE